MVVATAARPPRANAAVTGGAAPPQSSHPSTRVPNGSGASGKSEKSRALTLFIGVLRDELVDLVTDFEGLVEQSFAQFRELWAARRLSTVFHVEFWNSTPTDIHHAVLQTALDLLVERRAQTNTVATVGYLFALYCAYSVQPSDPKIRISIDPAAWQTLSGLVAVLTELLHISTQRQLAREAMAMLRRLVHDEHAFLHCLGGSVAEYRATPNVTTPLLREQAVVSCTLVDAPPPQSVEAAEDLLMRLEVYETQYNDRLQQLASRDKSIHHQDGDRSGGSASSMFLRRARPTTASRDRNGGSLGSATVSLWNEQRVSNSKQWLERVRRSFTLPSIQESDEIDEQQQTVAAQEQDVGETLVEDEDQNVDAMEDDAPVGSDGQMPPFPHHSRVLSVASSATECDGLAELEAELMRDVGQVTNPSPAVARAPRKPKPAARSTTVHEQRSVPATNLITVAIDSNPPAQSSWGAGRRRLDSDALSIATESDGLAELEAELARDVQISCAVPPLNDQSSTQRSSRRATSTGRPSTDTASLARQSSHKPSATRRPRLESDALSIATESDGLAELEAELARDVRASTLSTQDSRKQPVLPTRHTASETPAVLRHGGRRSSPASRIVASPSTQTVRKRPATSNASQPAPPQKRRASEAPQTAAPSTLPSLRRSRRLSIASSASTESDLELAALQAELERAPTTTRVAEPPVVSKSSPSPRRSRGLSIDSAATETDDELAMLTQELATMPTTQPFPSLSKQPPRKRASTGTVVSKPRQPRQPAQRKSTPTTKPRAPRAKPATSTTTEPKGKRPRTISSETRTSTTVSFTPRAPVRVISSRVSVASTNDSDGLDELERELQAFHTTTL